MEFENDAQRTTYDLVSAYMRELVEGGEPVGNPDLPMYGITQGSAQVSVIVVPRGDTAFVLVQSWVVTQVEPSLELYDFLLKANHDIYGAFSLDNENDIMLSVMLYGPTLDQEEFALAVTAVAENADDYDDQIVSRFGGLAAADRVG